LISAVILIAPAVVSFSWNARVVRASGLRFMGGRLLAVENCILRKEDQNEALKIDYKNSFELD